MEEDSEKPMDNTEIDAKDQPVTENTNPRDGNTTEKSSAKGGEEEEERETRVEDVPSSGLSNSGDTKDSDGDIESLLANAEGAKPGANINDSWGIFKEGWLDILGNGELRKKILVPGQGHTTRPQTDQVVTLRTKGWLEDGTEIDWHDSITIHLGDGDVVQAWDLAVILMELGEKAVITAAPRFAYGEEGRDPDIPPNSLVRYELELLQVGDAPDVKDMPVEERCKMADQKREQGNKNFARKDYANAISSYRRALSFIEDLQPTGSKEEKAKVIDMKVKCLNNLAAAQLKIEAYEAALKTCNNALALDPNSVKALFRKGKVLAGQLNLNEAVTTMKKALALEPSNKIIHQELSKVMEKINQEKAEEKQLYQKMVGDMANIKNVPEQETLKSKGISRLVLIGSASLIAISGVLIAVLLMK